VIGAAVADEPELPLKIGDGIVEPAARSQVPVESPVLGVELEQCLRIIGRGLDFCPAAHHLRVCGQPGDIFRAVVGDGDRIEARKRLADAVPLGLDHAPAHPGLEHWPAQRLQVPGKPGRPVPWWWCAAHPALPGQWS
jgi:hypothetical protein